MPLTLVIGLLLPWLPWQESEPTLAIRAVELSSGARLEFVCIPAGQFVMGDAEFGPRRPVTLTRPFWLARTETTWSTWTGLGGEDDGRGQPNHPARGMTWFEIEDFLTRFDRSLEDPLLLNPRLPTEAEWEYAARAGTDSRWSSGDDEETLLEHAWIRPNAAASVQRVATRLPNPWGLYDLHGNVWEWVADWHDPDHYADAPSVDPTGPPSGTERVRRGGSVVYGPASARSAHRYQQPPGRGNGNLGFRIAVDLPPGTACPDR